MKNIFIVLIIGAFAISCKNNLSKEEAAKQITIAEHYPQTTEYKFTKEYGTDWNTEGNGITVSTGKEADFAEEKRMIGLFEKDKLVTLNHIAEREESNSFLLGTTVRTWTQVVVDLTDEGKKYLIREDKDSRTVKLWEIDLDAITGIQEIESGKTVQVNYTERKINITPFGKEFDSNEAPINKSVIFRKYEDGWRIN